VLLADSHSGCKMFRVIGARSKAPNADFVIQALD
jgi:hypothetical protein